MSHHPTSLPHEIPVLIAGAGPVGLTLACLLRRSGVACLVIDAEAGPTPGNQSRALGIQSRTMEVLEELELCPTLLAQGRTLRAVCLHSSGREHARAELDFSDLQTPYPFITVFSQGRLEQLLVEQLGRLGGEVNWNTRLTQFASSADAVRVTIRTASGEQTIEASWLVGCDGAHSTVRKGLHLDFGGTAYEENFLLADVDLQWPLTADAAHLMLLRDGLVPAIPLPEPGCWRLIDTTGAPHANEEEAIVNRFRELLSQTGYRQLELPSARWTSAFRIHRRIVNHLRVGRCFLAGDAAHIHSPVGGQGMNLGMQDAQNLAWKLALVVRGIASERLLDSYEPERLTLAQRTLRGTDRATRLVTLRHPLLNAIRNWLATRLITWRPMRRILTRQISQLNVAYRDSSLVADHRARGSSGSRYQPGERVGDLQLFNLAGHSARLYDLMRGLQHTLLVFEGQEENRAADRIAPPDVAWLQTYRVLSGGNVAGPGILSDTDGRVRRHFGIRGAAWVLIRPDGYLGYAAAPPTAEAWHDYRGRLGIQ